MKSKLYTLKELEHMQKADLVRYIIENIGYASENINNFSLPKEDKNFRIYGASWCPYCNKARELLDDKNIPYIYYDIEDLKLNKQELQKKLRPWIGDYSTIPIIFYGDMFIGGFSSLQLMFTKPKCNIYTVPKHITQSHFFSKKISDYKYDYTISDLKKTMEYLDSKKVVLKEGDLVRFEMIPETFPYRQYVIYDGKKLINLTKSGYIPARITKKFGPDYWEEIETKECVSGSCSI